MPKVYVKTYGCQINERDSEQVARMFAEGGYTVTTNEREADAILVNTCSVRDQAEQKALGKMGSMMHAGRDRKHVVYGFMGCMAQSRGATNTCCPAYFDMRRGIAAAHIPQSELSLWTETFAR